MKRLFLVLVLFAGVSFAANNAIGVWGGDFNGNWGIDLKHLDGKNIAWDIYLGNFKIGDDTSIGAGFGYYFLYNLIKADASVGRFPLHIGPNLGFGYWSGDKYSGFDIGIGVAGGISWFTPTTPTMDISLELGSPSIGCWTENRREGNDWKRRYDPAIGLKGGLGLRLLFHVYFF
jgi:hypothetical protein